MIDEIQQAIALLQKHGYEVLPPERETQLNVEFENWWNLYNKKRGKVKCLRFWARMSKKDKADCIAATPAYVQSITDKQFQKDPFTYLNGRCWQDEIINPYGEQQSAITFASKAAAILNAE